MSKAIKQYNNYYGIIKNNKYYAFSSTENLSFINYTLGWNLCNRGLMRSFNDIYTQAGQQTSSNYSGRMSISYNRGQSWTLYSSSLPNGTTLSGNPLNVACVKDKNGNDNISVSTDDYDTYVFNKEFNTLVGTVSHTASWIHDIYWTWNPNLTSQGDFWTRSYSGDPHHVNLNNYSRTKIYQASGTSSTCPCCRYSDLNTPIYYYVNNATIYESTNPENGYTTSSIQLPTTTNFRNLIAFKGVVLCVYLNGIYYLNSSNNWQSCNIQGIDMSTVTAIYYDVNHNNDVYAIVVKDSSGQNKCQFIFTFDGINWGFVDFTNLVPAVNIGDGFAINSGKIYDGNKVDFCITNPSGNVSNNFIIHASLK